MHVAHEALGAKPGLGGAGDRLLRLGADLGRVALEERLGPEVAGEVGRRGPGGEVARVAHLEDVGPFERLTVAVEVRPVEGVEPGQADAQARDRRRVVDPQGPARGDGRRLEEVGLDRTGDGERLRLLGRLADGEKAHGALLTHGLADVRDPRASRDAREARLDEERGDGTPARAHDLA